MESLIKICASVEIGVLLAGIAAAILKRKNIKAVIRVLGVTTFVSLCVMILPYHAAGGGANAFWLSVFDAMRAMLMNAEAAEILDVIGAASLAITPVYRAALLFFFIVAPLFTIGITLSFFSERFAKVLYRVRSAFSSSCLFSAVNERTVCLAENIAKQKRRPLILFVIPGETEEVNAEWLSRVKKCGGYVISGDIAEVGHSLRQKRRYYLLDTDGGVNLENGMRLFDKYNDKRSDKLFVWIYTKDETASVVFDHLYETFHVQLINEEKLIAEQLVRDYPLYKAVKNGRLSVLILGAGNIGREIIRTVCWCGQLGDGIETEINVIDRNAEQAKAILAKTSPGLAEKFGIRFYSANIETDSLPAVLSEIKPDYIVVSLGEEKRNVGAGLTLRRFYGIAEHTPRIHVMTDTENTENLLLPKLALSDWKISADKLRYDETPVCSFELLPFGSYEKTYGIALAADSYDYWLAVAVNAVRVGITKTDETHTPALLRSLYNQVEYYKHYSAAYAVSLPYKLWLAGLALTDDGKGDLSPVLQHIKENENVLLSHESRRFEAFMRASGWVDMPLDEVKDGVYQDKLKKRHARIDAGNTTALSKLLGRDFAAQDKEHLALIPDILCLANKLSGKKLSAVPVGKGAKE